MNNREFIKDYILKQVNLFDDDTLRCFILSSNGSGTFFPGIEDFDKYGCSFCSNYLAQCVLDDYDSDFELDDNKCEKAWSNFLDDTTLFDIASS